MDKENNKNQLKVDFIGGEELTEVEKVLLRDYFAKKRKTKNISVRKHQKREKLK
ncbi:hypothetical protein [Lunatibacter salilacus]|uniref:hypothetical protein n=1 Tax=Lunatibacter salilacus TaxID=2483804 RepID=UPI00131B181C|nr:hypothetical protein [Lunatibacter salilacus]